MIKRSIITLLRPFLTGALALLPVALTFAMLAWAGNLLAGFFGPGSLVGRGLSSIGLHFVEHPAAAYVMGIVALLGVVYAFGLVVQTSLKKYLLALVDHTLMRLPLVRDLYEAASKLVGLLDKRPSSDTQSMSAVWVFFGGPGAGTATLALMPNPAPFEIDGQIYRTILLPTAPVPIGGALLYVRDDWIKPAGFGVDTLSSIYLSMGISLPPPYDRLQEIK